MDVEEAEKAGRVGDLRREFAIYKAHLEDLFYNKAQVVTQLKNEEVHKCTSYIRTCMYIFNHAVAAVIMVLLLCFVGGTEQT